MHYYKALNDKMLYLNLLGVFLKVAFCQKDVDNFFISQKIFRFSTLDLFKLLRPVHDIDKLLKMCNTLKI